MRREISFFLDPISPFTYFAAHQLSKLKHQHQLSIRCVPVLFAGLLSAHDNRGPAEIPPKRRYIFLDCVRNATLSKLPFNLPPAHPFNPLLPLRALTAIEDKDQQFHAALLLTTACWGHGKDITSAQGVGQVLDQVAGLSSKKILEAATSDEIKNKLRHQTQHAIDQGVFGVPTMKIDQEIFWGSDRIHHLEHYLTGNLNVDYEKFDVMLNKPRGADRKEFIKAKKEKEQQHH